MVNYHLVLNGLTQSEFCISTEYTEYVFYSKRA